MYKNFFNIEFPLKNNKKNEIYQDFNNIIKNIE